MASTTETPTAAQRRSIELPEYAAMMRRMLRSWGRRLEDADEDDLADLDAFVRVASATLAQTVATWRRQDRSWTAIGRALGITRQAAQQRFGHADAP